MKNSIFIEAFNTRDIDAFLKLMFPTSWQGAAARILESGVEFSNDLCSWAPRWSKVSPTIREGRTKLETAIKSCIFRTHDCVHQLWGLPLPSERLDETDFYLYKRAQMCGEVAVLTLIEFDFCNYLFENFSESKEVIWKRNAIPMLKGPLQGKTTLQIALRMDDMLHKKSRPKWVRDLEVATKFADDYVPMLQRDRDNIDNNFRLMKENKWRPITAPNARYDSGLDGLELTTWMINDFFHQCQTDNEVDIPLREFNKERRSGIILPEGWNSL